MADSFAKDFKSLLQEDPQGATASWGAKLQVFCERLWDLMHRDATRAEAFVADFIAVLQNDSAFALAGMVIPELREGPAEPPNPLHQQVINGTLAVRSRVAGRQGHAEPENPLYSDEKQRFADAEIYRAGLLLFHHGNLSEEEYKAVVEWLSARPVPAAKDQDSKSMATPND